MNIYPKAVFVDTNVFERFHFDFSHPEIEAFSDIVKELGIDFLMPAPIKDELNRHISDKAKQGIQKLSRLRRELAFFSDQEFYPKFPEGKTFLNTLAVQRALIKLDTFLKDLSYTRLNYDGVNLGAVFSWYHHREPPFSVKSKEFPDAVAISILLHEAKQRDNQIAVISYDSDIALACEEFSSLLYFPSLSDYVQAIISSKHDLGKLTGIIENTVPKLEQHIADEIASGEIQFLHYDEAFETIDSDARYFDNSNAKIIAVGHNQLTIRFESEVEVEHEFKWPSQLNSETDCFGNVRECCLISGTAKIALTSDRDQYYRKPDQFIFEFDSDSFWVDSYPDNFE